MPPFSPWTFPHHKKKHHTHNNTASHHPRMLHVWNNGTFTQYNHHTFKPSIVGINPISCSCGQHSSHHPRSANKKRSTFEDRFVLLQFAQGRIPQVFTVKSLGAASPNKMRPVAASWEAKGAPHRKWPALLRDY